MVSIKQRLFKKSALALLLSGVMIFCHTELRADHLGKIPDSIDGTYVGRLKFRKIIRSSANPTFKECPIEEAQKNSSINVKNLRIYNLPNNGHSYIFPKAATLGHKEFSVLWREYVNGGKITKVIALTPALNYEDDNTKVESLNSESTSCFWSYSAEIKASNAGMKKLPIKFYRDYSCAPRRNPKIETFCFSEEFTGKVNKISDKN